MLPSWPGGVWLICGKPQRQMWSWIRDTPFFIDMKLGTSPTNALTSYRTTTFSIALAANLRLEIGQKLLILLVSKDGFLRPGNVTAGFRHSGTLPHLNDALTIFVNTERNIIRDWHQSSWPVNRTHRIVTDVKHSNLKLYSGKLELGKRSITQVVFWRRSCLSKGFSLMIMGIILQLLLSTWISFHTNLLSVNRQLALPLRTVYFFSSASLSTYSLLTESEFIAIDHVIVDVLDEYLSAQVVLQMQVTAQ